jgi:Protocatechuate 3,4-dioxygenase beta subunit N terminal
VVTVVTYRDINPPYLFPAYDSTVYRASREPLIEAPPEWIGRRPSLVARRDGGGLRCDIRLQGGGKTPFFWF